MSDPNQFKRSAFMLLGIALLAGFFLAGCNYSARSLATETPTVSSTNLPTPTLAASATSRPSDTPAPSATSAPSATPAPSDTPAATATQPAERVGVVILNGNEIGTIQKSGENFLYTPKPGSLTPEVKGKVVLHIIDPEKKWGFDLDSSSSSFYNFKDDPRAGWESYGVLVAYEGSYEITIKFAALNPESGEKLKDRVRIKIVGATILATDTPEVEEIPGGAAN
jgi:hypothetical protein